MKLRLIWLEIGFEERELCSEVSDRANVEHLRSLF